MRSLDRDRKDRIFLNQRLIVAFVRYTIIPKWYDNSLIKEYDDDDYMHFFLYIIRDIWLFGPYLDGL